MEVSVLRAAECGAAQGICVLPFFQGYGGGFNERENVEYIEREESDGEYDEVREGQGVLWRDSCCVFFKAIP